MELVKEKYQRTTKEELECYMEFVRQHPEIQQNKNDPTNPKKMENLWDEVSKQLNSLKGPVRTKKKWKESLTHWKNQLRSRARKNKAYKKTTGGGPPTEEMNSFELRALEVFGNIVIDGLDDIPTLGTEDHFIQGTLPMFETNATATDMEADSQVFFVDEFEEDIIDTSGGCSSTPQGRSSSSSQDHLSNLQAIRRQKKTSDDKILKNVLEMMQQRERRDREFQQQFLNQQRMLASVLEKVGNVLTQIIEK